MVSKTVVCLLLAVLLAPAAHAEAPAQDRERFAVYYSDKASIDQFKPYQLIVFDSTHHPLLQPFKEEGKLVLGYLALGEIAANTPSFALLKSHNLILDENKNYPGNYNVDIRDPLWAKTVVEELIPFVLRQGFDGLFLDTLDNAMDLEDSNKTKYAGMKDAALHLIEAIRLQYPSTKIMLNRSYAVLAEAAPLIDYEMGESVYKDYDFASKSYKPVNAADYKDELAVLNEAKRTNPDLKVYTLDYADPLDIKSIKDIYATERANGFIPYVATIGLDRLIEEPDAP